MAAIYLRDYQHKAIAGLREKFRGGAKRVILCMPTGAGKTITFAKICVDAAAKGSLVYVFTDRTELLVQTLKTLIKFGVIVDYLNAKKKTFAPNANIVVMMVETAARRLAALKKPDLIIYDEAHKGNFKKIMAHWENVITIGATATPTRETAKIYDDIVCPVTIKELQQEGSLCVCRSFAPTVDISSIKIDKTGDYNEQDQFNFFSRKDLYAGLIDNYEVIAKNKKTLIFCANVESSNGVHELFKERGYEIAHIDGNTPSVEREKKLKWFNETPNAIVTNCGVLTTGFDEPTIEAIIVYRATTSIPLWLQMVGRGSRVTDAKKEFFLLDFGTNLKRLGLWEVNRLWDEQFLSWKNEKKKPKGVPPMKECKHCFALIPSFAKACPECGGIFVSEKEEKIQKAVTLVELIQPDYKTAKIHELKTKEIAAQGGLRALMQLAKGRGYREGWAWREWNKFLDNKKNNNENS